ncbi:chaperonin 10-like protein, partial [Ilyonectria sp. MPI-CAGE-AT-0026]
LKVTTKPLPVPQDGELLVKIISTSICASDLNPWKGYRVDPSGLIPGHEGVGVVVASKSHSCTGLDFKVGDTIGFLNTLRPCGGCKPCIANKGQYCESGKLNQGFTVGGFFAEYALVDNRFSVKIPEGLPAEKLSPLFCAGITAFAAVKSIDAPARGVVGVFGLGGVGSFAVQFAKALGFWVVGYDVSPAARSSALSNGAIEVVDSSDLATIVEATNRITGGRGLVGAVVAAGVDAAYGAAIEATGFGGTIVAVGVPASPINAAILKFVQKALTLRGTQTGSPQEIREMMDVVAKHNIIPDIKLHTLEDLPDLFETFAQGKANGKL